jgi:hypothetical protein
VTAGTWRGVGAERVAAMHISGGEQAQRWPMLALRDGSGDAAGSSSGSSVARQDLLAEKRSGVRNAVADAKKVGA